MAAPPDAPVEQKLGPASYQGSFNARTVLKVFGGAAAVTAVAAFVKPELGVAFAALTYIGTIASFVAVSTGALKPRVHRGELSVRDGEVLLEGKRVVPKKDAVNGALSGPDEDGTTVVRLGGKDALIPAHAFSVGSRAQGEALLAALGLDPAHRALKFHALGPMAYGWRAILLSFLPLLLGVLGVAGTASFFPPAAALFGVLGYVLWLLSFAGTRTHTVVGTDGVLTRWLGLRRFCSWSEVEDVLLLDDKGVRLVKKDGKPFDVVVRANRRSAFNTPADRERRIAQRELYERCMVLLQSSRAGGAPSLDAASLARNAREPGAWLSAVRALGSKLEGLRKAAVPRDAFWRVLEDGGADEETRAGAAAALSSEADEAERTRLRVAADTVASPQLRVVLEAAAEGDDARLEDALGKVQRKGAAQG